MRKKIINIPFKDYKTHTAIHGELTEDSIPLIILHGGPGGSMYAYEPLFELSSITPVIAYNQLGSAYSKVPKGNFDLYTIDTFMDELDNLVSYLKIKQFYLLGHSWGGMLALLYATRRDTKKIKKLILFSTLPSTSLWNSEHLKMIENYPCEEKEAIIQSINGEKYNKANYKKGIKRFYHEHVARGNKRQYYDYKRKRFPHTNLEIYRYMWGKSELVGTGTLKDYDVTNDLAKINIETLILNGFYDESSFAQNKVLNDNIKNSKWLCFSHSHHNAYLEEHELVKKTITDFVQKQ